MTLYTLNVHNVICKLYVNKSGGKHIITANNSANLHPPD